MKQLLIFLVIALFATPSFLSAQNKTEEEIVQEIFAMDKKIMAGQFMQITKAIEADFWAIYDAYEIERKELGMDRMKLIEMYIEKNVGMSQDEADEMMKESFRIQKGELKLKKKYYGKVKKDVNALTAAQFYQFEEYFRSAIKFALYNSVELIGDDKR